MVIFGMVVFVEWIDGKCYFWMFGVLIIMLFIIVVVLVLVMGWYLFWWVGLFIVFMIILLFDFLIGDDCDNLFEDVVFMLEKQCYYCCIVYFVIIVFYVSFVVVMWVLCIYDFVWYDYFVFVFLVGVVMGILINIVYEFGYKIDGFECWFVKIMFVFVVYGYFFVEYN